MPLRTVFYMTELLINTIERPITRCVLHINHKLQACFICFSSYQLKLLVIIQYHTKVNTQGLLRQDISFNCGKIADRNRT